MAAHHYGCINVYIVLLYYTVFTVLGRTANWYKDVKSVPDLCLFSFFFGEIFDQL